MRGRGSYRSRRPGSSTVKFAQAVPETRRARFRPAGGSASSVPLDLAESARSMLLAIPAFAVFHSASKGRTITGSMIRMILSRSV